MSTYITKFVVLVSKVRIHGITSEVARIEAMLNVHNQKLAWQGFHGITTKNSIVIGGNI